MSQLSKSWSGGQFRLPPIMTENKPEKSNFGATRRTSMESLSEMNYEEDGDFEDYEEELDFKSREKNKRAKKKNFLKKRTKVLGKKLSVMERRRNMIKRKFGDTSSGGMIITSGAGNKHSGDVSSTWRPVQVSPRQMVYRKRFGYQRPTSPSPAVLDHENTMNIEVISEEDGRGDGGDDDDGSVAGTVALSVKSERSVGRTGVSMKSSSVPPSARGGLGTSFNQRRTGGTALSTSKSFTLPGFNLRPDFDARQKFIKMTRLIIVLNNWISVLREADAGDDGEDSGKKKSSNFTDIVLEASLNGLANSGLTFDPAHYKAKKEINLSHEVKEILTTASAGRTPAMVKQATLGLQHLRSFAEYPVHMQEKLAKVAYYQSIPAKRVIIRQGHTAENFYFILSGHAAVTLLERHPQTGEPQMKTVNILKRGWSFGELALLHHAKRAATVVSQDHMQLLAIGRADFFTIFMSGSNPGDTPEHVKFISNLEFMKDWPLDQLLEHPEMCLIHFYKKNVVIAQDSTKSDWIYIIKSGTCQVMKQLRSVKPNIKKMTRTMKDETLRLPKLGTGEQSPRIDTRKTRPLRPMIMTPGIPKRSKTQLSEQFGVKGSVIDRLTNLHHDAILDSLAILHTEKGLKTSADEAPTNFCERRFQLQAFPEPASKQVAPGFSKSGFEKFPTIGTQFSNHMFLTPGHPQVSMELDAPKKSQPKLAVKFLNSAADNGAQDEKPKFAKLLANKWLAKSKGLPIPDEEDIKKKEELRRGESVFVQVELLKPRDVFGLTAMKFDDYLDIQTTKVSLVSRGAECIMLSKKFFIHHATDRVKENIKNLVRKYPSEKKLQQNLQLTEDWAYYKNKMLNDITDRMRTRSGLT